MERLGPSGEVAVHRLQQGVLAAHARDGIERAGLWKIDEKKKRRMRNAVLSRRDYSKLKSVSSGIMVYCSYMFFRNQ